MKTAQENPLIFPDYESLSQYVAGVLLTALKANPDLVLCLATGDTPRRAYQLLVESVLAEKVDVSHCTFIGLDEWIGIPPDIEGSCHHFLQTYLFDPLRVEAHQVHLFNSLANDPEKECLKMDQTIASKNGIDLMLVGVGMNGHIGFNEPGVSPDLDSHVISLDATTQSVGQKYFQQTTALARGITLGFKPILASKKLLMVASGTKKAQVIKTAIEYQVGSQVPASLVRLHPNREILLDEAAASQLEN